MAVLLHAAPLRSRKAREAVEDRPHDVVEKRALSGLDVNVGGHPGRRAEFRHAPENIILVQTHPNDVESGRVSRRSRFGFDLHLLGQGIGGHIDDACPDHRCDALVERGQPHQRVLAHADVRDVAGLYMRLDDELVVYRQELEDDAPAATTPPGVWDAA